MRPVSASAASLRLSVTDRCNLRCAYCLPAGDLSFSPRGALLGLEALAETVAWLVARHGVEDVKITGGEPLVRRGVPELVARIAALPGIREVSMTTNGTQLRPLAGLLARAGLKRVNVSLDTLDPRRFADLTRGGNVADVLDGIDAARAAGLAPLKGNAVLRRSSYREDVPALLDLAAAKGVALRFIELMRTGTEAAWAASEFVSGAEVRAWLAAEGSPVRLLPAADAAPARPSRVAWRGGELAVGWIDPVSHAFCGGCDRLRLDARGRLRRCLMDDAAFPLGESLARGERGLEAAVAAYLAAKRPPGEMATAETMAALGG